MHTYRWSGRSRSESPVGPAPRPRPGTGKRSPWMTPLIVAATLILCVTATHAIDPIRRAISPRVLIVGGGPDLHNNQVAIESNVRYVGHLLPQATSRLTLFAYRHLNHPPIPYAPTPPR